MSVPTQPIKAEDIGAILSRSFNLLFAQIGQYLIISLAVILPMFLISMLGSMLLIGFLSAGYYGSEAGLAAVFGAGTAFTLVMSLIGLIGGSVLTGALVHAADKQISGDTVSFGGSYKAAFAKWVPLLLVTLVVGLAVGVGSMLLIIPGLVAAFFLCLAPLAVMLENAGLGSALGRSCSLALKAPGEIIVIALIAFVASFILALIPVLGWFLGLLVAPWAVIALTLAFKKAQGMSPAA